MDGGLTANMKDTRLGDVLIRLGICPITSRKNTFMCGFRIPLRLVLAFIGTFARETKQPTKKR